MASYSYATRLKCIRCGADYPLEYLLACRKCNNLVEFEYDLKELAKLDRRELARRTEHPGIWKLHEMLPIASPEHVVSLGEGNTPLIPCPRFAARLNVKQLLVKFEGTNPTGTFKDRSSATAIAAARSFGFKKTAVVTTGNAGASIAAYAARGGIESIVFCYSKSAPGKLYHLEACATKLVVYEGGYDEIAVAVGKHLEKLKIFDSDARRNPYKHEGKKSLAYEFLLQLDGLLPDVILVPVSLGEVLIAMWRGFREMKEMGWIDAIPRLVACQSSAANPVVRAFEEKKAIVPQQVGYTIAEGVAVGNPGIKGERVLDALRATNGLAVAVDDSEIVEAMDTIARVEGLWCGPTGATVIAALTKLLRDHKLDGGQTIACVVSETGLKADFPPYPAEVQTLDPDKILRILEGTP